MSRIMASGRYRSRFPIVSLQDDEDRTEDRNGWNQQYQHADVEVANEAAIGRTRQHRLTHRTTLSENLGAG